MRLSQCIATHDRYFDNTIVNFSRQTTLLCGPAQSGKSFLMESIIRSIYDPHENGAESSNPLVLNITFEENGSQYRILRDSSRQTCVRLKGNSPFNSTGFSSDDYFLSAYVFSPADHNLQEKNINFSRIVPLFLDDEMLYYRKGQILNDILNDSNLYRQIQCVRRESAYISERSRLHKDIEIREIKDGKLGKLEQEKKELIQEIEDYSDNRNDVKESMRKLDKLKSMVEEYNEMKLQKIRLQEQKEEEIEKDTDLRNMIRSLKKNYPRFFGITADLRNSIQKIGDYYTYLTKTTERIEYYEKRLNEGKKSILIGVFLFLVLTASVFTANYYFSFIAILHSLIAAGLLAGVSLVFGIMRTIHFNRVYSTAELVNERNETENMIISELAKNNLLVNDSRGKEIYNFVVHYLNDYSYYYEREEEIKNNSRELEELKNRHTDEKIAAIDKKIEDFSNQITDYSVKIGVQKVNPDNFDYEEYLEEMQKKLDSIDNECSRIETIIKRLDEEVNDFNPAAPDRIDDRLAHVEEQISHSKRSERTLFFLADSIGKIVETESMKFKMELSQSIVSTLEKLGVKLDTEKILTYLNGGELDDNPSIRQLLLISLKISIGLCCKRISIPLILDEPTVFMDKKTVVLFSDLIKTISESRQVIILTHDPDQFSFENRVMLR